MTCWPKSHNSGLYTSPLMELRAKGLQKHHVNPAGCPFAGATAVRTQGPVSGDQQNIVSISRVWRQRRWEKGIFPQQLSSGDH